MQNKVYYDLPPRPLFPPLLPAWKAECGLPPGLGQPSGLFSMEGNPPTPLNLLLRAGPSQTFLMQGTSLSGNQMWGGSPSEETRVLHPLLFPGRWGYFLWRWRQAEGATALPSNCLEPPPAFPCSHFWMLSLGGLGGGRISPFRCLAGNQVCSWCSSVEIPFSVTPGEENYLCLEGFVSTFQV